MNYKWIRGVVVFLSCLFLFLMYVYTRTSSGDITVEIYDDNHYKFAFQHQTFLPKYNQPTKSSINVNKMIKMEVQPPVTVYSNLKNLSTSPKLTSHFSKTSMFRTSRIHAGSTTTPTPIIMPMEKALKYYEFDKEKFTITGSDICTSKTKIVVLIQTSPNHFEERMAIRNTWGSVSIGKSWPGKKEQLEEEIRVGYMFGKSHFKDINDNIIKENNIYKDVIVADFQDSYRNLTLKSMFSLKWVDAFCPAANYFIKADDDTFVHLPNLIKFLNVNPIEYGIVGALGPHLKVMRQGKWKVDISDFPDQYFPPYYSGPTYIINTGCIKNLLEASKTTPMIPIEDAYVTGILALKIKARRFSPGGFAFTTSKAPTSCDIRSRSFYSGSNLNKDMMSYLYSSLTMDLTCQNVET